MSSKRDTYGPGGSYGFFSGRDGSRGFTTGKFDDEGLVDEVEDLDEGQLVDIHVGTPQWKHLKDFLKFWELF